MLKVFQLRVARSVLGLGVRDIGAYINLSRSTISKIERKGITTNLIINTEQNTTLVKIFNDKRVFFPNESTISYEKESKSCKEYLTRFQLRGGRAILALSQRELSENTGIEKNILNYLENLPNTSFISLAETVQTDVNSKLKNYFHKNNIFFPTGNSIKINS